MLLKDLICDVLEKYPETRASDNKLYYYCCKKLGKNPSKQLKNDGLSIISVHKYRQLIQNKLGLYRPDDMIIKQRKIRENKMRELMNNFC